MKLKGIFKVTKFKTKTGVSWLLQGTKKTLDPATGKFPRVRMFFQTEAEALGKRQELEIEGANVPVAVNIKTTRLTNEQLAQAEQAYRELNGKPLLPAIRYFLANYQEPLKPIKCSEALDGFIKARTAENLRPHSIRNLRIRVGHLLNAKPDALVSDLQPDFIRSVIEAPGRKGKNLVPKSPISRSNERRAISSFFTWAMSQGHVLKNPILAIGPITTETDEPQILTLGECRRLMDVTAGFKEGKLLPYITLALFAGIRPTELQRLSWDDIDLEAGHVTISARIAKMRARRVVEFARVERQEKKGKKTLLPPNVSDWLREHAVQHTPVFPAVNFQKDFNAVKRKASIKWEPDILRHTAISYHLAHCQHEGRSAAWGGNSPDVIQRCYRGLVKPGEAAQFFDIRPDSKKLIALPAASTAFEATA